MNNESPKTRRRFLADLLFLGGGITAASLLAKSAFLDDDPPSPEPQLVSEPSDPLPPSSDEPMAAGDVDIPDRDFVEPDCEVKPEKAAKPPVAERDPFSKGGDAPPAVRGLVAVPSEPSVVGARTLPPHQ